MFLRRAAEEAQDPSGGDQSVGKLDSSASVLLGLLGEGGRFGGSSEAIETLPTALWLTGK